MQLYKIKAEYERAFNDLLQVEDITPELIENSLAVINAAFDEKALAVGAYIKNLDTEHAQMVAYQTSMAIRIESNRKKVERLEAYLKHNMMALDKKKIEGIEFDVKIRKSPDRVVIDDENLLKGWLREKITVSVSVDKEGLKKELSQGKEIKGAHLEHGYSLIIK